MPRYYIGFDCGTQGTKVAIYADDSTLVSEAYREHEIVYPKPGWAEMNPEQFYRVVKEGIQECIQKGSVNPRDIHGISCSGIICGFVPIDDNWNPVGPYIPYLDGRSASEAAYVSGNIEPVWIEESGNTEIGPFMPPIILRWMLRNQPDLLSRTRKVVTNSQYVMGRLGGLKAKDAYIDWGNLSGWIIGYDARSRNWSERQLRLLGIPRELLPRVVNPAEIVGTLTGEQANELGLIQGIPLVAGSGDIMQSNLGSGVMEAGQCSDVSGTASIFTVVVENVHKNITGVPGIIYSMGTVPGQYLYWGYIRAGGLSLGWFKDELMMKKGDADFFRNMDLLAATSPLGSNSSLFYPFLQGGDASLPDASAALIGLHGASDSGSIWRSMLEGIAFEYLSWVKMFRKENIFISEIVGTGGGAKSAVWNQMKADMLGASYITLKRSEGAVLGNAMLAAYGVGDIKDMKETVSNWIRTRDRYHPDPGKTEAYHAVYGKRQAILNGPLREVFAILKDLKEMPFSCSNSSVSGQNP